MARLWFVLARDAAVGAILRTDGSEAHLIRWNLEDDTFEPGQWLKGRVLADKCDLSPDGLLFSYVVLDSEFGDAYSVSRLPYFTPLALWPGSGSATPHGVFVNRHILRADVPSRKPKEGSVPGWFDLDRGPVSPNLLHSVHGWKPAYTRLLDEVFGATTKQFSKEFEWGKLVRDFSGNQPVHRFEGLPIIDVDCADVDKNGRVLFSREGKLFAFDAEAKEERELADFGGNGFQETLTPDWATSWY